MAEAGHEEAYTRQCELTRALIHTHHQRKPDLDLLDYGCGWRGVQRVIFEGTKNACDRLALFDPICDIHQPRSPNERIVENPEIFSANSIPFDLVALSYVLCCVTPEEGKRILHDLHVLQPQAQLLIVDYTLKNRSQMEVLNLLTSREETKWRQRMGDQSFASTRRRFTAESFEEFVHAAGHRIQGHAAPLDTFGIRAAVLTVPEHTIAAPAAPLHDPIKLGAAFNMTSTTSSP
ncbi:MAG: hypothetical protein Q7S29_04960 [Candidatus Peribacter sp.]|nr:hypothetical protein [Candidatus Peribacter sp.]